MAKRKRKKSTQAKRDELVVKLENVSKTYYLGEEAVRAVDKVSIEIKSGEFVGILGSSGCGKSTLMYLMGLLETPTSGKIMLGNRDVSHLSDDELSKIRSDDVGFVFQQFNLINKFTVLENVLLPIKYAKAELKLDPRQKAEELLKKFNIYERANFFPNKISGGQQQRTAIARALIMDPKIILADEPTGNLDSKTGDEIMKLLEDLNRELGTTIIVVTHERVVAKRTRRQIYMHDGQVVDKPYES